MPVFGMVTTAPSAAYTDLALSSFFETVSLGPGDRFILIDNDGAYGSKRAARYGPVDFQANTQPLGFSENMNSVFAVAEQLESDLFLLNNDLVFSSGWLQALQALPSATIASPLCNQQVQHQVGGTLWGAVLELDDYLAHPEALRAISAKHLAEPMRAMRVITLPFFCVRIPVDVWKAVGRLDESYGVGGGEDNDYCLRAYECGFSATFTTAGFVLHFNGKSTWGAESPEESAARCEHYQQRFISRWGQALASLCLGHDLSVLSTHPEAHQAAASGDFRAVIELLRP